MSAEFEEPDDSAWFTDPKPRRKPSTAARRPPPSGIASLEIGSEVELAEYLLRSLAAHDEELAHDGETFRRYERTCGTWGEITRQACSVILQKLDGANVAATTGSGARILKVGSRMVRGATDLAEARLHAPRFFANPVRGLAFQNGFLRLRDQTVTLEAHSPEHRATWAYDFPYDPSEASVSLWSQFLSVLFQDDRDGEARIRLLQQWGGAALLGIAPWYERALIIKAGGSEGKSTLLAVLRMLFPADAVCAVSPQRMEDEYQRIHLAGKRLNIVAELPAADILDSEAFKAIVTGKDLINGRFPHGRPVDFLPAAAHAFACNTLPRVRDVSEGFWRRWLLLPLTHRFAEHEKVRDIEDRIVSSERAAIVNWFLRGALDLLGSKGYDVPPSCVKALEDWRGDCNPIGVWFRECCRMSEPHEKGNKAEPLYREFRQWCQENGHGLPSATIFGQRLKEHIGPTAPGSVPSYRRQGEGIRYRVEVLLRARAERVEYAPPADVN